MKIHERRANLLIGLLQFLWEEIKTLNRAKIKSLSKIVANYLALKFMPKKKEIDWIEAEYRISSY